MGFFNDYKGDILAAPAGKNVREVKLILTGVTEISDEEFNKLPIPTPTTANPNPGVNQPMTFKFKSANGIECEIVKTMARKTKSGTTQYSFHKTFIDNMRTAIGLEVGESNAKLINKEFTIKIFNNSNNMVDYDIALNDADTTATESEDSGF